MAFAIHSGARVGLFVAPECESGREHKLILRTAECFAVQIQSYTIRLESGIEDTLQQFDFVIVLSKTLLPTDAFLTELAKYFNKPVYFLLPIDQGSSETYSANTCHFDNLGELFDISRQLFCTLSGGPQLRVAVRITNFWRQFSLVRRLAIAGVLLGTLVGTAALFKGTVGVVSVVLCSLIWNIGLLALCYSASSWLAFRAKSALGKQISVISICVLWMFGFLPTVVPLVVEGTSFFGVENIATLGLGILLTLIAMVVVFSTFALNALLQVEWHDISSLPEAAVHQIVEWSIARRAPLPKIGFVKDYSPNAFTYGSALAPRIVFTTGLFDTLPVGELTAVIAHELGHIDKHHSAAKLILFSFPMLVAAGRRNSFSRIGDPKNQAVFIVLTILCWLFERTLLLILLGIERGQERKADALAAYTLRDPNLLVSALIRIAYGISDELNDDSDSKISSSERASAIGLIGFAPAAKRLSALRCRAIVDPVRLMEWEVVNPWARWRGLFQTHPWTGIR